MTKHLRVQLWIGISIFTRRVTWNYANNLFFFHFTFLWRLCLIPSLFSRSDEDIEAKCAPSLISLLTSLLYIYRPRLSNHEQRRSIDHCSKGRSGCRRPTVLWTSQPQAILLPANVLMSLYFQDACLIHNGTLLAYIWSIIRNLKGVLAINERGLIATNHNSICYANKEKIVITTHTEEHIAAK